MRYNVISWTGVCLPTNRQLPRTRYRFPGIATQPKGTPASLMAIRSKYLSESDVQRLIDESERDVDRLAQQQEIDSWIKNPANAQQLAAIRAEFARIDSRRAQPAPTAQQPHRSTAPPGSPSNPIPGNARFSPDDLKYDRRGVQRVIDPHV